MLSGCFQWIVRAHDLTPSPSHNPNPAVRFYSTSPTLPTSGSCWHLCITGTRRQPTFSSLHYSPCSSRILLPLSVRSSGATTSHFCALTAAPLILPAHGRVLFQPSVQFRSIPPASSRAFCLPTSLIVVAFSLIWRFKMRLWLLLPNRNLTSILCPSLFHLSAVTFYQVPSVMQAFVCTASVFVGLTLYSFQTKRDFTPWLGSCITVLWVLIFASFLQVVSLTGCQCRRRRRLACTIVCMCIPSLPSHRLRLTTASAAVPSIGVLPDWRFL